LCFSRRSISKRIDFIDEVFAWNKKWTEEFRSKYKARINLPFHCAQHPEMVDREKLSMLKDAGLERVEVGIQSGSERVRKEVFKRPIPDRILLSVAQMISELDLVPVYDLIVDNPFETEDDLRQGLSFILELPRPFHLRMYPLTYFPNTPLTMEALRTGKITPERVESRAERTHSRWFVTLDYPWAKRERYWISLFSLTSKSFVPKSFIRMAARFRKMQDYPAPLSALATLANNTKLALIALKWFFEGKPVLSFMRQYGGIKRRQSHWHI
jgi:radical SAM superfamily enzyme YgiQ (UPF0313 family)